MQAVAKRCARSVREIDILGRYGGDEFVLVLPETGREEAYRMAKRLRQHAGGQFEIGPTSITLTISLGVASLTEQTPNLAALIEQADAALYRAKGAGRIASTASPNSPSPAKQESRHKPAVLIPVNRS